MCKRASRNRTLKTSLLESGFHSVRSRFNLSVQLSSNHSIFHMIERFQQLSAVTDFNGVLDSNAQFKLAKKLKKFDVLERMYWVHLYRELYPEITAWQIGDRLRVSPALDVVNFNRDAWKVFITNESSPLEKMQSLVGRDIYNARYLLLHMERGSFPKHTKFELSERHQPFGLKFQTEYRQATESTKDKKSEWHQWLEDRYGSELFRLLKEKHHFKSLTGFDALEREKKLEHMKKYDRFKRYVRGEINHWA